jgi:hypothetical protein
MKRILQLLLGEPRAPSPLNRLANESTNEPPADRHALCIKSRGPIGGKLNIYAGTPLPLPIQNIVYAINDTKDAAHLKLI